MIWTIAVAAVFPTATASRTFASVADGDGYLHSPWERL
jgi:hypothetical protein